MRSNTGFIKKLYMPFVTTLKVKRQFLFFKCISLFVFAFVWNSESVYAGIVDIYLDADTPETGSYLDIEPLVVSYGSITFSGLIEPSSTSVHELEFLAAGSTGSTFNILGYNLPGILSFDFDVKSLTFIYGGNKGDITIEALDASGMIVDSYYQADTYFGQPAGPLTLSGSGIRSLKWYKNSGRFCALDNISIEIPEPSTLLLLGLGALIVRRRRR